MSEVQALLRHYAEVRNRLQRPPNAVPDTGIDLRRNRTPPPQEPSEIPTPTESLTEAQQARLNTFKTSFCRKDVTFRNILKLVAAEFGIDFNMILSRRRTAPIVLPRQVAFYLANKHLQQSLASMGRHMGLDHTSVLHGRNKIKNLVATNPSFCDRIKAIEAKLLENYPGLAVSALNQCTLAVEPRDNQQCPE